MRNKAKNFPKVRISHAPDDQSEYLALRPDGSINGHPRERTAHSRDRDINQTGGNRIGQ